MKALLVKPKPVLATINRLKPLLFHEPLELAYLAAASPDWADVRILDLRLHDDPLAAFRRELAASPPDVLGLTGFTTDYATMLSLCHEARKLAPQAKTVVGGHHATVRPADFQSSDVDFVVRGEGCAPFRLLLERLQAGANPAGIPHCLTAGDCSTPGPLPSHPELDSLPAPRRSLYHFRDYSCVWPSMSHPKGETIFPPVALFRSSFGCVMNCSFCVVPLLSGGRHLVRAVRGVVEEIQGLEAGHVYFCDDETFTNTVYIRQLAEALGAAGARKRYFAWARSTTVLRKPELFALWRRIGLDAVFLGFEAATDAELRDVSKQATVAENERAHRILLDLGVAVVAAFMVRPDYTAADFDRLCAYVRSMPPAQFNFTVQTPTLGSPDGDRFASSPGLHRLHDGMHALTPTTLPLSEFHRRFAALVELGAEKNPLRLSGSAIPPLDIHRAATATRDYVEALREACQDSC